METRRNFLPRVIESLPLFKIASISELLLIDNVKSVNIKFTHTDRTFSWPVLTK